MNYVFPSLHSLATYIKISKIEKNYQNTSHYEFKMSDLHANLMIII